MTLVGKIFTVLILIMSILFMALSMMVFASHKNWKLAAINTTPTPDQPLGLKPRLEQSSETNTQLRKELEQLKNTLAKEKAARRQRIASLETKKAQLEGELNSKEQQLAKLTADHGVAVKELETTHTTLDALTSEVGQLRDELRNVQEDRDNQLAQVVKLNDELHSAQGDLRSFQERNNQLVAQVSSMKKVMDAKGLRPEDPVDNIPPKLEGLVTAIGSKDLIEISLGADDGLRVGHQLEVYRENKYVGRVVIKQTDPNRAVAQVLPEFLQTSIQKGDRVFTKLS
jgi:myosin heavy subunit